MPSTELLAEVRDLVSKDRLNRALGILTPVLEAERKKFPRAYRDLLSIQGELSSLSNDIRAGILSPEQINLTENRIRNRFLGLLDHLEHGPAPGGPLGSRQNRLLVYAALGLVGLIGGWFGYQALTASGPELNSCPPFQTDSDFRILLHPFQDLKNEAVSLNPHQAILARLDKMKSLYAINTHAQEIITDKNPFLGSSAEEVASNCDAQLVIWGTYEKDNNDALLITTQFQFFAENGKINMRKAEWDPVSDHLEIGSAGTTLSPYGFINDTVSNLTEIIAEGTLTEQIEQTLLYLSGIIAHQSNNPEAAIMELAKTQPLDSANQLLRTMSLADSYLAVDDIDKSLNTYDEVLEIHPDYPLALNNRAYLNISKRNFDKSMKDLDRKIEMNPKDKQALKARWEVNLLTGRVKEAEQDLKRLVEIDPDDPQLDSLKSRTIRKRITPSIRQRISN